jgi:hypothetical protein
VPADRIQRITRSIDGCNGQALHTTQHSTALAMVG